jgi:L-aminopeptidase/D-esterase-like protein
MSILSRTRSPETGAAATAAAERADFNLGDVLSGEGMGALVTHH